MPDTPHYRVCNYCEAMCGVAIDYDPSADSPEKIIRVRPDKKDPFSKGRMCPKATAFGPLYFDADRLKYPVRRVDGEWVEITWPEAYRIVSDRLIEIRGTYGENAVATYLGNPIVHNLGMLIFVKTLTRAIGSRNVFSATSMDQLPHHFAAHYMFGHGMRIPVPDIDRTNHMIILGANPVASNGSLMTAAGVSNRLREIEARGGCVVVIDPRKTETAEIASEHHFIRPGTDVFLLLAMLHIVFRDNAIRLGVVEPFIKDFDSLRPLFDTYQPSNVAPITGIDAECIETMTTDYLSADRAVIYGRMGVSTQPHGGLCHWLLNVLNIVTGNFDTPGGMMFPTPAIDIARGKYRNRFGRWRSRVRGLKEFSGELPVSTMADEMLTEGEGQVRAFVSICGNPVLSSPGGHRLDEALEHIDFMVSIDNYINETSRHADVILPTPSGLEIDHYDLVFNAISVSNNVKFSEPMFDIAADRPFDWQILKELARRVSATGLSFADRISTPRRLVNWGLMLGPYGKLSSPRRWLSGLTLKKVIKSKHGIRLGPLRERVPECLKTSDKMIHIAPAVFTDRLAEVTATESAESARETPHTFTLIGRRNLHTNNTWMHQVSNLVKSRHVRCTAMINPQDAESLKVADGDSLVIRSRTGFISLPAELTNAMMPGVISIPHGFGHNRKGTRVGVADTKPGVSMNDITDPLRVDKLTGNAAFSGQPITVEKMNGNEQERKQRITG